MHIDFLLQVFLEHEGEEAFVWQGRPYDYRWLLDRIECDADRLRSAAIPRGSVVVLHADFSPHSIAMMLCLIGRGDVVVPIGPGSESSNARFGAIAEAGFALRFDETGELKSQPLGVEARHPLYRELASLRHPGLVLFSSGSSGEPKGVVHDFARLLQKYRARRQCHRTLAFMLFDHIGGLDTALYSLSNGSCLVFCKDRTPDGVCKAIEDHRVAVLPSAPSFLNLLAISGAWRRHDLSSLEIVTYGAEMMPERTLRKCSTMFPGVTLMQKYGTSEVGTLRSKSRSSDSLWVRIGGEGYETRVVNGKLEIKAESSMLGYLDAESPFTEDGWFMTGDLVEADGDFIRFLGRDSDVINVGGRKVFPAEVEGVIAELENIEEVSVFGEANDLVGQVVSVLVRTLEPEDPRQLRRRVRAFCRERLESYKVPIKVEISDRSLSSERFKRLRGRPRAD